MRYAGEALTAGSSALAGTLAAMGADSMVNKPENHARSTWDAIGEALNSDPEVGSAWNYVFGDDQFAPIHKQSLSRVLLGKADQADISILSETGAMPRVQELISKRPDLAETVGSLAQMETDMNVIQIDQGVTGSELAQASPATAVPSIVGGIGAGAATALGANALVNRFRK